jgi:hypothetical protein
MHLCCPWLSLEGGNEEPPGSPAVFPLEMQAAALDSAISTATTTPEDQVPISHLTLLPASSRPVAATVPSLFAGNLLSLNSTNLGN